MRFTSDVLLNTQGYLNTYGDRELSLRGMKAPLIENISVLEDQFDVLDLSDNEILALSGFPLLNRLKSVLIQNNRISRISLMIGEKTSLPNLEHLILTNNNITSLIDIKELSISCPKLKVLSFLENSVMLSEHYRKYTIFKFPVLNILDWRKITAKERKSADDFFKSSSGKKVLLDIENDDNEMDSSESFNAKLLDLTEAQREQVRTAIVNASTKLEVDMIESQLIAGTYFK